MENKTLLVDRNAFCDWYFDYEVCRDFFDDHDIFQKLINKSHHSEIVAAVFDKYLNSSVNLLLGLYCFYAIVYIFYK